MRILPYVLIAGIALDVRPSILETVKCHASLERGEQVTSYNELALVTTQERSGKPTQETYPVFAYWTALVEWESIRYRIINNASPVLIAYWLFQKYQDKWQLIDAFGDCPDCARRAVVQAIASQSGPIWTAITDLLKTQPSEEIEEWTETDKQLTPQTQSPSETEERSENSFTEASRDSSTRDE